MNELKDKIKEYGKILLSEYDNGYAKGFSEALNELDKIRAEIIDEILSHSGTGEEVIQAYADGLEKGLDIIDKHKIKIEVNR